MDLGFLGDTIHLVPALWGLKSAYAGASLHVVTTPLGAEVLRMVPCVDRAWAVELHREKRTLRQQWNVIRQLRREHFEVAFNFSGADRTLFMTALSGARQAVAYPGVRRHFWNRWLIRHWAPRQNGDRVVFEQRRAMLADCGLPLEKARFDLQIDPAAVSWADAIVPPFAMHLSINSSKATREWPLEHHRVMLEQVWKKCPDLVVVASAGARARERERLTEFAQMVQDARLQVVSDTITISQLAAILRRCRLHLGPDSGVLHLAFALGLPTISFFREQGDYKSFMPIGPRHRVITMPCHCVDHRDSPCEGLGRAECFAQIEPARVAELVSEEIVAGG